MTLSSGQRAQIDRAFSALSDPTRRAMVELLGRDARRASDIADALDLARPAASKHLRMLREAGLIEERGHDDARVRIYALRRAPLDAVQRWLDEVESFWSEQLGGFAAHVEARAKAKGAKRTRSPRRA